MRVSNDLRSLLAQYQHHARQNDAGSTATGSGGQDLLTLSGAATGSPSADVQAPMLTDALAGRISARLKARDPALFAKLDANGDGRVSAAELSRHADPSQSVGGFPRFTLPKLSEARAVRLGKTWQRTDRALFLSLDTNKDGKLSSAEAREGNPKILAYFQKKVAGNFTNELA